MTVDELVAKLQEFPGYWTVALSDPEVGYPPVELVEAIQGTWNPGPGQTWEPSGGPVSPPTTPLVVLS